MYLPFKKNNNNNYILIKDEIKIERPLPSCENIFSNINICEKIDSEKEINYGNLVNFFWHGVKIEKDNITKNLFDKYYSLYKEAEETKIVKLIGFNESIKVNMTGDSLLGNLLLDAIKNITKTNISIINNMMFRNGISPGFLSIIDFIKLMPLESYLCKTELTGEELIKIIKTVQIGKKGYHLTSGLKQTIKIINKDIKEVINVQFYEDGILTDIDKNKIYTLSSNNLILSEESKDEFTIKDSLDIIQNKYRNNRIQCSTIQSYIEIMNYFKIKEVVDLRKDVDMSKPRIVIIEE
jgi:2',3'-cyclic-nucleotide 2'-phosphodiesterase (5'-nucleotidase family)